MKKFNPGTEEALKEGCKCPVIDNHFGKGYDGKGENFWYSEECEYHKN